MRRWPSPTADPVAVIQSAITMLAYGQRMNRRQVLMEPLRDYWIARVEHLLRACVCDRAAVPPGQGIDVPFHQLVRDDVGWVRQIYDLAGLPCSAEALSELKAFSSAHEGDYGRVRYDLQGQFGVDPADLRRRFAFYFEAFPDALPGDLPGIA